MKQRWRRIVLSLSVLLSLLVFAVLIERMRGEISLRGELEGIKASGGAISYLALKPSLVCPASNVVVAILSLTNELSKLEGLREHSPPSLKLPAPGVAVAVNDFEKWVESKNRTNTWAQMDASMELARAVLSGVEAATLLPAYDTGMDYENGFVDFKMVPLVEVKNCCNLLNRAALYDLKQQNLSSAHREVLAMIRLAARQTPEPIIISQLVRQACAAITFNATWQTLQQQGWTDEQFAALQKAWTGMDLIRDMEASLEMERALTLDFYKQVRGSRATLEKFLDRQVHSEELVGAYMGKLPARGFALRYIFAPLWRTAWEPQDEAAALRQWNVIVRDARTVNTRGWKQPFEALDDDEFIFPGWQPEAEERNYYDRCRFLFFTLTPNGVRPGMIKRTLEYQTQQQMVLAAIALERYKLQENRYPEHLSELVPIYIETMPIDHMNKEPLRYSRMPGGAFTLYSVGENGRDDLGNPQPEDTSKRYRSVWDGRDAVWPKRAPRNQAQAAVLQVGF